MSGRAPTLRYEIIPADGIGDRLAAVFPQPGRVTLTVTSLPQHGIQRTLAASEELAALGFRVVPHLSAGAIAGRGELGELLLRMRGSGITEAFVISGDAPASGASAGGSAAHPPASRPTASNPAGYATSLDLVRDLHDLAPDLMLGIAGYPEGHPAFSPGHLHDNLVARLPFVDRVVTQLCFSAEVLGAYAAGAFAEAVAESGVVAEAGAVAEAPTDASTRRAPELWLGVPGFVRRTRLLSLSTRIGVGASLRFLKRSRSVAGDLMRSRDFDPRALIGAIVNEPRLGPAHVAGLHVYTFNEIERLAEFDESVRDLTG